MYIIIGADGREYGPVTADQVRAWMAAGRADLETKAKAIGDDTWRSLGDFPAFGGDGAEPPSAAADSAALPAGSIARTAKLDIADCYQRSWDLLKADFWPLVGAVFLVTAIQIVLCFNVALSFAGAALSGVFAGGVCFYFLKKIRRQPATMADLFAGFRRSFLPLLAAGIVIQLLVLLTVGLPMMPELHFPIAGVVLLMLPGFYLAVAYAFTYALIIDRKLPFWTALEVSRRVITAQWWRVFGLMLLAIPLLLLGCLFLAVGVFIALPVITGAFVYAYEDLCNRRSV